MSRHIEMRTMFRVMFPDGTHIDAKELSVVDDRNGERIAAGDGSATWNNIAAIAVVRVPVVVERTSILPPTSAADDSGKEG